MIGKNKKEVSPLDLNKNLYVLYVTETYDYYINTWQEIKQMAYEIMQGRIENNDLEIDVVAKELAIATKDGCKRMNDEYTLAFLNAWQYELFDVTNGERVPMKDYNDVGIGITF